MYFSVVINWSIMNVLAVSAMSDLNSIICRISRKAACSAPCPVHYQIAASMRPGPSPNIRRPDQQVPIERQRAVPCPIVRLPHRPNLYTTPHNRYRSGNVRRSRGPLWATQIDVRRVLLKINFRRSESSVLFDAIFFDRTGKNKGGRRFLNQGSAECTFVRK